MRNPQGYATITDVNGSKEQDTFTCSHCQKIVGVKPLMAPEEFGGMCKVCYKLICPRCVGVGACTPFERQMEIEEARERARKSYESAL
jgi:hypothetical protein